MSSARGANILAVFSCAFPSHLIVEISMAKVLAENGHNVTVITTLNPHVTHKNINLIYIPLTKEEQLSQDASIASMVERDNSKMISALFRLRDQVSFAFEKNRNVMKDRRVIDLYENTDNQFDLVMIGYFLNDFQIGIAQKLKVPVVIATSMYQWEIFESMLGSVQAKGSSTFSERLDNLIVSYVLRLFTYVIELDNAKAYKELYGNDPSMPAYADLNKNVSLVLFNSHSFSEGPIRSSVPAVIEVGGIQIKDKPDPLPLKFANVLSDAKDGAILLCLGSNVRGSHLKPSTVKKMFNVLSKLKQKVIWKWEDLNKIPGKSENILYSEWVPQDDILAHPKIRLFINHAGRGGINESQFHGKPMLSLPVFGDQPANADKMVKDGFGLSMSLLTLEEQPFHDKIIEVLENPEYTQKVKAFSKLFRDRPLTASQSVLYWTEYVLRHHGAPHLQGPLVHMGFIAANNLDVYAFLTSILIFIIFSCQFIVKFVYRKLASNAHIRKVKILKNI
ncbi:UDP-glycosyltransferase UGT5-like [Drosophila montana]|uniref:UDP-glycosyltransferase UGT5-like n=1 Tax=Drosophila montana TaxID=40370 RepID=UPI00313DDFFC